MEKNNGCDAVNFLHLLSIASELHVPFSCSGYQLVKGLCLVTENPVHADAFVHWLQQIGDCKILPTLKCKYTDILNFQLGIHSIYRYDKEEDLVRFLSRSDFLTVLLSGGIVPDFIDGISHVIVLSPDFNDTTSIQPLKEDIHNLKRFLRKHPDQIKTAISQYPTSIEYLQYASKSELYVHFCLALHIYRLWYRNFHNEPETNRRFQSILHSIHNIFDMSEYYTDNTDIADVFIHLFSEYSETHNDVHFFAMNNIGRTGLKLLDENAGILYDDSLYFVPECLLKKICLPLIQTFGWNTIKKSLKNSGILYCNDLKTPNFTCKKVFFDINGNPKRYRFICLYKNFFIPADGLAPEERSTTAHEHLFRNPRNKYLPDIS